MVQMNLFEGRNRDTDIEKGYVGPEEGACIVRWGLTYVQCHVES